LYGNDQVTGVVLGLWVLAMLAMPALERRWGWLGLRAGLTAVVCLQSLAAVLNLAAFWSPGDIGRVVVGIVAGGWLAEFLGVTLGFPFGSYRYTCRLQPQVGRVPTWVTIAYVGILVPAWGIADLLVGGNRGPAFVLASAGAATAWDLLLDPQLVSWRVWAWRKKGGYFGIPWGNFLGWLGITAALTLVLQPGRLEPLPLTLIYGTAWFLQVIALLVAWPLRGPAMVGGGIMGAIVIGACLRLLA
jgi:putative membrane protein